jgi:hypothetical protein
MEKLMKVMTIKKIVVKLFSDSIHEFDIDTEIFDDPFLEAATRAVEQSKVKKYGIIRPVMECWEKKDEKIPKKHYLYNSYWILVNSALYGKAELLREKFMKQTDCDLAKEPIRGNSTGSK